MGKRNTPQHDEKVNQQ